MMMIKFFLHLVKVCIVVLIVFQCLYFCTNGDNNNNNYYYYIIIKNQQRITDENCLL